MAVREIRRPIDRIDIPDRLTFSARAVFFGEDAMMRQFEVELRANELFGAPIVFGDEIDGALFLDGADTRERIEERLNERFCNLTRDRERAAPFFGFHNSGVAKLPSADESLGAARFMPSAPRVMATWHREPSCLQ